MKRNRPSLYTLAATRADTWRPGNANNSAASRFTPPPRDNSELDRISVLPCRSNLPFPDTFPGLFLVLSGTVDMSGIGSGRVLTTAYLQFERALAYGTWKHRNLRASWIVKANRRPRNENDPCRISPPNEANAYFPFVCNGHSVL